ncbi:4742_t:CDS:2, partial [Cetraspora pellucida]
STTYRNNIHQDMCFSEDYKDPKLCDKPKGLKKVLHERGLWHDGMKLVCKAQHGKLEEAIIATGHKAFRYMNVYCKGLTGKTAEYAVKKYQSHCHILNTVLNEI